MSIAGQVSIEMLRYYSHIRQDAKRKALATLDSEQITSQLAKWKEEAETRDTCKLLKKQLIGRDGQI
jgi:hypothetical protein